MTCSLITLGIARRAGETSHIHTTPCGTRTRNLRIRSPTPCPLGQGGLTLHGVARESRMVPPAQHFMRRGSRCSRVGHSQLFSRPSWISRLYWLSLPLRLSLPAWRLAPICSLSPAPRISSISRQYCRYWLSRLSPCIILALVPPRLVQRSRITLVSRHGLVVLAVICCIGVLAGNCSAVIAVYDPWTLSALSLHVRHRRLAQPVLLYLPSRRSRICSRARSAAR